MPLPILVQVARTFDASAGGRFSFLVLRGGEEIDHVGEYIALERPRRLAFTWAWQPSSTETAA